MHIQRNIETDQTLENVTMPRIEPSLSGLEHARFVLSSRWAGEDCGLRESMASFDKISVSSTEFLLAVSDISPALIEDPEIIPVNLSDFDGTLTSGSSGSLIFEHGVAEGFFLEVGRPRMENMLRFFSLEAKPNSPIGEDFLRVLSAFREWGAQSDLTKDERAEGTKLVYEMLSWIYAGHTPNEVHAFARSAFNAIGYEQMYFKGAREIIEALADRGISTLLISVKFQPIVEVAAEYFGIKPNSVAGMNLCIGSDGRYTTELRAPMTFREGKEEAAHALIKQFSKDRSSTARPLMAMGDSPSKSDEQMLAMAVVAIAVEPQTPYDADLMRNKINCGARALILDYEETVGGEPLLLFNRHSEEQTGAVGRFI